MSICLDCKHWKTQIIVTDYGNTLEKHFCLKLFTIQSSTLGKVPVVLDCPIFEKELSKMNEQEKLDEITRLKEENEQLKKKKKSQLDEELENLQKENKVLKENSQKWLHG